MATPLPGGLRARRPVDCAGRGPEHGPATRGQGVNRGQPIHPVHRSGDVGRQAGPHHSPGAPSWAARWSPTRSRSCRRAAPSRIPRAGGRPSSGPRGRLLERGVAVASVTSSGSTSARSGRAPSPWTSRAGPCGPPSSGWTRAGPPHVRRADQGLVSVEGYGLGKLLHWVRLTGGAPSMSGKDRWAHILYLQHEHPEVYRSTYKFLEPKDWLNLRLTGRFAASYDSIALHWVTDNRNLSRVSYDERLLRMTGLHREKLPRAGARRLGARPAEPRGRPRAGAGRARPGGVAAPRTSSRPRWARARCATSSPTCAWAPPRG